MFNWLKRLFKKKPKMSTVSIGVELVDYSKVMIELTRLEEKLQAVGGAAVITQNELIRFGELAKKYNDLPTQSTHRH